MQTDYKLLVYDTSGARQYEISDFIELIYTKTLNNAGLLSFTISDTHSLANEDYENWQVEVWRKPQGENWARDFIGIIRNTDWEDSKLELTCMGILGILDWRIVAYPSSETDRTVFTDENIETIANTLVKYNATPSGTTADGRDRNAGSGYPFDSLTVEADGAGSDVWAGGFYCARKNLLKTIQELANTSGSYFDIVKTSSTAWQWRWYAAELKDIVFAISYGNMKDPSISEDALSEKTVAIVAGQGEGSSREIEIVEHSAYSVDNDIEEFVDARDVDSADTDGLESRGMNKLLESIKKYEFTFDVIQTPASLYGVHYFLGNKITAINPRTNESVQSQIVSVTVELSKDGTEKIDIEVL
jgi:hypothetical protein